MSTVCVLTPIVIGSWPMIASAIFSAAGAMGFTVAGTKLAESKTTTRRRIEADIPNSEVLAEEMARGEKVRIQRGDVTVEFGVDERGRCSVCVTGESHSDAELRKIGEEVAGRVVQQFAYHKLMTELKERNYRILEESVEQDDSIQVRVRFES